MADRRRPLQMIVSMARASASILCSRVFGLLRDICMAWYWGGTGLAQAAFTLAFAIPNMLRALFGEGAFTSVFVPMLSKRLQAGQKEEAWELSNRAISLQMLVMAGLIVIGAVVSWLLYWLLPNVSATWHLVFLILPILLPYGLLICVTGSFAGILNSHERFGLSYAVPIIFNLVQISTMLLLFAMAWTNAELRALMLFCVGALLAGVLQLLAMVLLCRRVGYVFHFDCGWKDSAVRGLCLKMLPGVVGVGVLQINNLLDKVFAGYLGPAAVGALNYSQHLIYLPVGVFGVAMNSVCLTALSKASVNNDEPHEFSVKLNFSLQSMMMLSLPCVVFLMFLGEDVIKVLFARGAFVSQAVENTYMALLFYLLGLPAFCCAKVAVTPFHARLDTATPVKISLECMFLNLILNLVLMRCLGFCGLALSTSICSWINLVLLLVANRKFAPEWNTSGLWRGILYSFIPAFIVGIICWGCARYLIDMHSLWRIGIAGMSSAVVYGIYLKTAMKNKA